MVMRKSLASCSQSPSRRSTSGAFAMCATRFLHLDVKDRRSSAPCHKQGAFFSWRRQVSFTRAWLSVQNSGLAPLTTSLAYKKQDWICRPLLASLFIFSPIRMLLPLMQIWLVAAMFTKMGALSSISTVLRGTEIFKSSRVTLGSVEVGKVRSPQSLGSWERGQSPNQAYRREHVSLVILYVVSFRQFRTDRPIIRIY